MSAAAPKPSPAKDATPRTIAAANPSQFRGMLAPNPNLPSARSAADCSANVASVESTTAVR
jgi:hypothetical protein